MVFIIDYKTIIFDAIDPHYDDYKNGTPACTIRGMTDKEIDAIKRVNLTHIEIMKRGLTGTVFRREITNIKIADMYKLDDGRTPVVISWKHPEPHEEILTKAIQHYGEPAQVLKAIEELAELQESLIVHLKCDNGNILANSVFINMIDNARYATRACKEWLPHEYNNVEIDNTATNENIISELADVAIMHQQMCMLFDVSETELDEMIRFKLKRLEERIQQ